MFSSRRADAAAGGIASAGDVWGSCRLAPASKAIALPVCRVTTHEGGRGGSSGRGEGRMESFGHTNRRGAWRRTASLPIRGKPVTVGIVRSSCNFRRSHCASRRGPLAKLKEAARCATVPNSDARTPTPVGGGRPRPRGRAPAAGFRAQAQHKGKLEAFRRLRLARVVVQLWRLELVRGGRVSPPGSRCSLRESRPGWHGGAAPHPVDRATTQSMASRHGGIRGDALGMFCRN